jgi:DNA-binding response OmpR family regulator/anti-anti-sigma regulatory factor
MALPTRVVVLVVDDDPVNLKVLSQALAGQSFSIAVATDGEMALEQVRHELPDLILLDAVMPGMDGFEVCRRLKADPATQEIPVIFMTALAEITNRIRGFNLGAVDYVTKPFEREELLARVNTHLALRAAVKVLSDRNEELQREVEERASAQAALASTVQQLRLAQADIASTTEELRRAKGALEVEVARRTEELRETNHRLERELAERQAEVERAALQEQIISAQAMRLTELSTPIIPISDRILVMPLIGFMDEERAGRVLGAALERAAESQAEVMILDITGVPEADEHVAAAILKTARALRLLGARTVLTGIRPDVAQALVSLEVDFTEIVTQSTLQGGIAYALNGPSRKAASAAHPAR